MLSHRIFKFFCSVPRYSFQQDNRGQHIKALQIKIQNLRSNYHQECNLKTKMQHLRELQEIHRDIVQDQSGICIEQLLDKLTLANMQFLYGTDVEPTLAEEIIKLDMNQVHFHNIIDETTPSEQQYILHQARQQLYRTRLHLQLQSDISPEQLLNYCELYKESTHLISEYHKSVGYDFTKEYYLAGYHEFRSMILLNNSNTISEGIDESEYALRILGCAINQQKVLINYGSDEVKFIASNQLSESYKILGNIFRGLAKMLGQSGQNLQSQSYYQKALELFQQVYGIHHILYIKLACEYILMLKKSNENDCLEKIQSLYDSLQNDKGALLYLFINLFFMQIAECQNMDLHLHNQIEDLLNEGFMIDNEEVILQYYISSIQCSFAEDDQEKSFRFINRAIQKVTESHSQNKVKFILSIHDFINQIQWWNPLYFEDLSYDIRSALINLNLQIPVSSESLAYPKQVELFQVEYLIIIITSLNNFHYHRNDFQQQELLNQIDKYVIIELNVDFILHLISRFCFGVIPQSQAIFNNASGNGILRFNLIQFLVEGRKLLDKCLEIATLQQNAEQMKLIHSEIEQLKDSLKQTN